MAYFASAISYHLAGIYPLVDVPTHANSLVLVPTAYQSFPEVSHASLPLLFLSTLWLLFIQRPTPR
jgi:hypothetical protein